MPLILSGQQRKILRESILAAYPNPENLVMVIDEQMDIRLGVIERGNNYDTRVFNLLQDMEAQGRLEELIKAVIRANPDSPHWERVKAEVFNPQSETPLTSSSPSNARKSFLSKRLAQKQEELAAIESQLAQVLGSVDELKLNRAAENLLQEIEKLEADLSKFTE
jgi:hypothetical protein